MNNKRIGFTLAEMMMVLLLVSIILAVAAPIITKRSKATISSGGDCLWTKDGNNITNNNVGNVLVTKLMNINGNGSAVNGNGLIIGTIGDPINTNVPMGAEIGRFEIAFPGWRDMEPLQIGAKIAAIRKNVYTAGAALVQGTDLAFYTGGGNTGGAGGMRDITAERMRIYHNGQVAINGAPDSRPWVAITINSGGILANDWLRTVGNNGWYNETYGGGWYMEDSSWIRAYNSKNVYTPGQMQAGSMQCNGNMTINGSLTVNGTTTHYNQVWIESGTLGVPNNDIWVGGRVLVKAGDGNYYPISDRRLKNVGEKFDGGLDKIRQLKVYNYTFKKDKEKTPQVGVMAQDLQKVFPDAVTEAKAGPDKGYLFIRWDDIFYAMVNAIKELDNTIQGIIDEINSLITSVTTIEDEIEALKNENEQLKERLAKLEKRQMYRLPKSERQCDPDTSSEQQREKSEK